MVGSTGYFPLERGTRQGDPISAYLFIFALEILLIQIRENADTKGIIIDETEIKLSAYADDGSFFVTDIHSLQAIFFICNQLREFSSLKLNLEKSGACWTGKAKVGKTNQLIVIRSTSTMIKLEYWVT